MSAPIHFLRIEGDMAPRVICTAGPGDPCRMVCDSCEESCSCDEPNLRDLGECNPCLYLNDSDDLMEIGEGVAELPIDLKWEGDYYSWSFAKQEQS